MAVRHQLIHSSPEAVWAVLADASRYGEWVVGPARTSQKDGRWPETGARLEFVVEIGRWSRRGETVVRRSEPPHILELEASGGWMGTARIALELRPWGEETLVICDEHPLRGVSGHLHNTLVDVVLQLRHRGMLKRLARVVEETQGTVAEPS